MRRGNKLLFKGEYKFEVWRKGIVVAKKKISNGLTTVGINDLLGVGFRDGAKSFPWYIGLISNVGFSALLPADTMSSHAGWAEFTAITQVTRPEWENEAPASRSITNTTPAVFDIDTPGGAVVGAFLVNEDTIGGTTGLLFSTGIGQTLFTLTGGEQIKVYYTLSQTT